MAPRKMENWMTSKAPTLPPNGMEMRAPSIPCAKAGEAAKRAETETEAFNAVCHKDFAARVKAASLCLPFMAGLPFTVAEVFRTLPSKPSSGMFPFSPPPGRAIR
ncbi:hypothetical protein DO75_1 [Brucella abortus]|nr:hypothetical protein DO75_1 [Brucella abortus]